LNVRQNMNALQSPVLWLVVIAIAAIAILIATKKHNPSKWGLKDVVKNPVYWQSVNQAEQEADSAVLAAKNWSDAKIADLTRRFVLEATSSRDAWNEARILRALGERTHPIVLGLLRDASLYSRLVKPTGKDILPEAPFNRACDLLGDSPGPEAVEALAPYLNDSSKEIRKDAALAVAKTGVAAIIPLVRKAFSDPDEYVRSYALMGLEFALNRSGLSERVQGELLPDVLTLLRANRNADKAAAILYRFNSVKAKEFFLSQEVFTAESQILHEILKVLSDAKDSVPRDALQSLVMALERSELKYPKTYALGEALRLLGQERREEDRDFIRSRTTHSEEQVAQGAAAGLLCSFGLEGFERKIADTESRLGYDMLTEHQRLYTAVSTCDAEINNGGIAQYFVNSSGNQWRDALAGFKAMGFKDRFSILNEAVAMFEGASPSTDRSIRQDQLSKLYKRNDAIFEALESRYYKSAEVVQVLASRFVLENPEAFR
jgi:HEAT repeat protein